MANRTRNIHAVDLFCGIGGLTHGLRSSGVAVKAGYDLDATCQHAFEANNLGAAFVQADVRDLRYEDLEAHFQGSDVSALVGCAPCQPFSAHTRRSRDQRKDDCSLLLEFARLVEEGTPDIVSIENVPGLAKHEAFAKFVASLRALDYPRRTRRRLLPPIRRTAAAASAGAAGVQNWPHFTAGWRLGWPTDRRRLHPKASQGWWTAKRTKATLSM